MPTTMFTPVNRFVGLSRLASDNLIRELAEARADPELTTRVDTVEDSIGASARDFGAQGDGSSDDTTALQRAIDSAGTVRLFPGTYLVSAPLTLGNSGDGTGIIAPYGKARIKLADNSNCSLLIATGRPAFCSLRRLIFDGNRTNQDGDGANDPLVQWTLGDTNAAYGTGSIVGHANEIVDAYAVIEDCVIIGSDGNGLKATGALGNFRNVHVIGCNGVGIEAFVNDAQWTDCVSGATWKEGWICAGGSARYMTCKTFFNGTGGAGDGSFGNYNAGYGFKITSRGQAFVGCQAQDTDGPGFSLQADDIVVAGAYIDAPSNLKAVSQYISEQSPPRGGGFNSSTRAAIRLLGANNAFVSGLACDRGVSNGDYLGSLPCLVEIQTTSDNYEIYLSANPNILSQDTVENEPWVKESSLTNYWQNGIIETSFGRYRPRRTLLANDATPRVFGGGIFVSANGSATTVTDFTTLYTGLNVGEQFMYQIADANTTIQNGSNIITKSGSDITAQGLYQFIDNNGTWYEI